MILIEGSDGVGKTTLAKLIQRTSHRAYVHYGPLPAWWRQQAFVHNALPFSVYDRYHWSTWAYAAVHAQPVMLSVRDCQHIDDELRVLTHGKYRSVLLYSSDEEFFESLPQDDMFDLCQVLLVNERFTEIAPYFDIIFDVSKHRPGQAAVEGLLGGL